MDQPLNGLQVQEIVGHPIGLCLFTKMKYKNLDDLFVNDCCLINYLFKPKMGHWCALVRNGNTITYFNPTGRFIDETIDLIKDYKENQNYPYLLKKLYNSDYNVRYMNVKLQKDYTNTCGRWCALFMKYRFIGEDLFAKIFKNISNNTIISITNNLLNNNNLHIYKIPMSEERIKRVESKLLKLMDELNGLKQEEGEGELADRIKKNAKLLVTSNPLYKAGELGVELAKEADDIRDKTNKFLKRKIKGGVASKEAQLDRSNRLDEYRKFVAQVNQLDFMKKFKGTGKRKAQSILYEFKTDAKKNGYRKDLYTAHVAELSKVIGDERPKSTLAVIKRFINGIRKEIRWESDLYKSSRKF